MRRMWPSISGRPSFPSLLGAKNDSSSVRRAGGKSPPPPCRGNTNSISRKGENYGNSWILGGLLAGITRPSRPKLNRRGMAIPCTISRRGIYNLDEDFLRCLALNCLIDHHPGSVELPQPAPPLLCYYLPTPDRAIKIKSENYQFNSTTMARDEENQENDVTIPGKGVGLCCAYFIPPLGELQG